MPIELGQIFAVKAKKCLQTAFFCHRLTNKFFRSGLIVVVDAECSDCAQAGAAPLDQMTRRGVVPRTKREGAQARCRSADRNEFASVKGSVHHCADPIVEPLFLAYARLGTEDIVARDFVESNHPAAVLRRKLVRRGSIREWDGLGSTHSAVLVLPMTKDALRASTQLVAPGFPSLAPWPCRNVDG